MNRNNNISPEAHITGTIDVQGVEINLDLKPKNSPNTPRPSSIFHSPSMPSCQKEWVLKGVALFENLYPQSKDKEEENIANARKNLMHFKEQAEAKPSKRLKVAELDYLKDLIHKLEKRHLSQSLQKA